MRSRLGLVACACVSVLVLTACGGEDPQASPGSPGPEAPSSPAVGTEGPEETPSQEEEPSVPLASGDLMEFDVLEVRAPRGWVLDDDQFSEQTGATHPELDGFIGLTVADDVLGELGREPMSLDELAELDLGLLPEPHQVRRRENVELDGVEFYRLSGLRRGEWTDVYGTNRDGKTVTLSIDFRQKVPEKQRRRVVASVLPTLKWR